MALARIASILAFSYYSNVGRVFTLLEGHGLDLVCNDRKILKVDKCVVLREFPCDVKTACVVNNGPCKALNLFIRRGAWKASVSLLNAKDDLHLISPQTTLAFTLRGSFKLGAADTLNCGDTLHLSRGESANLELQSKDALLYTATPTPTR